MNGSIGKGVSHAPISSQYLQHNVQELREFVAEDVMLEEGTGSGYPIISERCPADGAKMPTCMPPANMD
jgi:hypothetical protein